MKNFHKIIFLFFFLVSCSNNPEIKGESEKASYGSFNILTIPNSDSVNFSADSLIKFLGHSIKSRELNKYMELLEMNSEPHGSKDVEGNVYMATLENLAHDVSFEFDGCNRFEVEYGEAKEILRKDSDELVLTQFTIDSEIEKTGKGPTLKFPFGLHVGDCKDSITKKLGVEPSSFSEETYGYMCRFNLQEVLLLAALNSKKRLIWIRVFHYNSEQREKNNIIKNDAWLIR